MKKIPMSKALSVMVPGDLYAALLDLQALGVKVPLSVLIRKAVRSYVNSELRKRKFVAWLRWFKPSNAVNYFKYRKLCKLLNEAHKERQRLMNQSTASLIQDLREMNNDSRKKLAENVIAANDPCCDCMKFVPHNVCGKQNNKDNCEVWIFDTLYCPNRLLLVAIEEDGKK